MNTIKLAATLEAIKTLKDGSFKITFETQELPPEEGASLLTLRQSLGWLIYASMDAGQVEIPDEPPAEFKADKTPSQRLRSVLYVWWEQLGKPDSFESFYRSKIETIIGWVKDKLETDQK